MPSIESATSKILHFTSGPVVECLTPAFHPVETPHTDLVTTYLEYAACAEKIPVVDTRGNKTPIKTLVVYNPRNYADDWEMFEPISEPKDREYPFPTLVRKNFTVVRPSDIVA